MLQCLIHGKLEAELFRSPGEIEDLLTSVALGSCEYLPPTAALLPFLSKARTLEGRTLGPEIEDTEGVTYDFWPSWDPAVGKESGGRQDEARGSEPDLFLRFRRRNRRDALLVVECKLFYEKSSLPTASGPVNDQLGKYWLCLRDRASPDVDALGLVYLTYGLSFPRREFKETWQELERKGFPPAPLYWLSWHALLDALDRSSSVPLLRDLVICMENVWHLRVEAIGAWPAPSLTASWSYRVAFRWMRLPSVRVAWHFEE